MKKSYKLSVALVVVVVALLFANHASAAIATMTINLGGLNPLSCANVGCVVDLLVDFFIAVATMLTTVMVLWGGFQILTAAGDPEKVKKGGKTVLYAAIGLVVVWLAKGIVSIIQDIVK